MKIYILCPAKRVTGGVELAHQLCHALNTLTDISTFMWYMDIDNTTDETAVVDDIAPEDYAPYLTSCAKSLSEIDIEGNVVVFPEGLTGEMNRIKKAKKVLWWMSVDNYLESTGEINLKDISRDVCLHLYQSYYAQDYVSRKIPGAKGMFLSDYINEEHGRFIYPADMRKNIALYNPRKGYKEIEPLIHKADWIQWVPLFGMTREKVILMMQLGKIYVDFGNHPGKDRIPREAASNGCVVITNRKGSAAYNEDVPIPEEYKFKEPEKSMDEIDGLMHEICDNFSEHQARFKAYRDAIKSEKADFDRDVCKLAEMIKEC